jgi:tetratricopeptide (TPR) repeat protein
LLFLSLAAARAQTTAASADGNAQFDQLSAQAESTRGAGRVEEAIAIYQRALQLRPDWEEGWWYAGTLNYDADHYAEAIPALQQLIGLNPKSGPGLAFLGLCEFETKDYANALQHLQRARSEGYGEDAELAKVASYHLALLRNRSGQFEASRKLLEEGIHEAAASDPVKVALGMELLRIPLLPTEVDPANDALIHAAGETAALLATESPRGEEALQHLISGNPKVPYLHYAHADVLAREGKSEEALRQLDAETAISPQSALPYIRMAALDLRLDRAKQALAAAQRAVELAPRSAEAHRVLGEALESAGETQEGAKQRALAGQLESIPEEIDLAQRNLYAAETSTGIKAGSAQGPSSPAVASNKDFSTVAEEAGRLQAAGKLDSAVSLYRQTQAARPDWDQGWMNLGTLLYAKHDYAEAIAPLKKAVAAATGNGTAWALLGLAEFEVKDYENSLIHLQRGRELGFAGTPAAIQIARYHLGLLLIRKGDFDKATGVLVSEVSSGPLSAQVQFALGLALLRIPRLPGEISPTKEPLVRLAGEISSLLHESKYDEAYLKFDQALKLGVRTPYLHYAYGCALAATSRFDEAEQQLVEESKITPTSPLPYLRRSAIALQLHRAETAAQLAQEAGKLDPESAEAHYSLGRAWLEMGKSNDAVKELESARRMAPDSPQVRFSLARAYAKAGMPAAAQQERGAFEHLNSLREGDAGAEVGNQQR